MNEQDRELVLKCLCAMLPYNMKLHNITTNDDVELYAIDLNSRMASFWKFKGNSLQIGDISNIFRGDGSIRLKPYLRPMEDMTEEERQEYGLVLCDELSINQYEWFNAHYFDYMGLIEKGLAIDCTGLNIY